MAYRIYLDDLRDPVPASDWLVIRDIDTFAAALQQHGLPSLVSFDHDLADTHVPERTGLTAAHMLVEFCLTHNVPLPDWRIHSANPVGRDNIQSLLHSFARFRAK
jgi:hypothetical protein